MIKNQILYLVLIIIQIQFVILQDEVPNKKEEHRDGFFLKFELVDNLKDPPNNKTGYIQSLNDGQKLLVRFDIFKNKLLLNLELRNQSVNVTFDNRIEILTKTFYAGYLLDLVSRLRITNSTAFGYLYKNQFLGAIQHGVNLIHLELDTNKRYLILIYLINN
jgi:hypothetical protein